MTLVSRHRMESKQVEFPKI